MATEKIVRLRQPRSQTTIEDAIAHLESAQRFINICADSREMNEDLQAFLGVDIAYELSCAHQLLKNGRID